MDTIEIHIDVGICIVKILYFKTLNIVKEKKSNIF